jgi:TonB family protein
MTRMKCYRHSARCLAACACLLAFARSTAAQTIGGEVVEAMTAKPLRTYQVRLFYLAQGDTTGARDSTTTDERGLFQFAGQGVGAYRLEFGLADSRLATSARVEASTRDTMIALRFLVPVLELGGAQALDSNEVQEVARPLPSNVLRYPKDMLSLSMTGEVVARFVVDSTGRVRPGSFAVLRASHPAFTRAVTEALPKFRFAAARVGGIPVPQWVVQPFTFSIERAGEVHQR